MSIINDKIRELNFFEIHRVLLDNNYYDFLFPFLLIFALFYTILCKIRIFQYKKDDKFGEPIKPVIIVISLVVSFFAITFQISDKGYNIGELMMMMFPNISALTIGILCLYIAGSILAKNFFNGLFKENHSAIIFIAIGAIGLGSVIYYVGIAMGFFEPNIMNNTSQWNIILAVIFLILGIVFLFIDLEGFGIILLFVFGTFIYNYDEGKSILQYFIDPVIFILFIVTILFTWMDSDKEKLKRLETKFTKDQKSFDRDYNGQTFKPYENKIYDMRKASLESLKSAIDKIKK